MSAMLFDAGFSDNDLDRSRRALEHISGPLQRLLDSVQVELWDG